MGILHHQISSNQFKSWEKKNHETQKTRFETLGIPMLWGYYDTKKYVQMIPNLVNVNSYSYWSHGPVEFVRGSFPLTFHHLQGSPRNFVSWSFWWWHSQHGYEKSPMKTYENEWFNESPISEKLMVFNYCHWNFDDSWLFFLPIESPCLLVKFMLWP